MKIINITSLIHSVFLTYCAWSYSTIIIFIFD